MSPEFVDPFEPERDVRETLLNYALLGAKAKQAERELESDPYMALAEGRREAQDKRMKGRVSNREYAANDGLFRASCDAASVQPTMRQASKYRRKQGMAYSRRVQK